MYSSKELKPLNVYDLEIAFSCFRSLTQKFKHTINKRSDYGRRNKC